VKKVYFFNVITLLFFMSQIQLNAMVPRGGKGGGMGAGHHVKKKPQQLTKENLPRLILEAMEQNKFDLFVQCLNTDSNLIDIKNSNGFSLLHIAAQLDRLKMAKYLLRLMKEKLSPENFASHLNIEGAGKHTPLHLAADAGCFDVVMKLCEGGANIWALNTQGNTPKYLAARHLSLTWPFRDIETEEKRKNCFIIVFLLHAFEKLQNPPEGVGGEGYNVEAAFGIKLWS